MIAEVRCFPPWRAECSIGLKEMALENFKQGKVVHDFNPGTQEWEAEAETEAGGSCEFEAIVVYISSFRTAKTTKTDSVSKNQ